MTVEEPDTEVTVQELLNAIREWEDELENLAEPKVCNAYGMQDLGGGVYVGITLELLNNWKVKFEGRTSPLDTGTITTTDATGEHLIDSTAQFITDDLVYAGCTVFNANTADMAAMLHIESEIMICSDPLSGGAGGGWTIGNTYAIYPNVQCTITGGNLTGLLSTPIAQSPNVQVVMEQSSSATLRVSGISPTVEAIREEIDDNSTELAAIKKKTNMIPGLY